MHNGRAGQVFVVMDRDLLAEVIAEAAEQQFGSLHAGVTATNQEALRRGRRRGKGARRPRYRPVNYSTVHRLVHRETGQVKRSTFDWLRLFVPKSDHQRLLDAVVSPFAQGLMDGHDSWLRRVTGHVAGNADGLGVQAELAALRHRRTEQLLADMMQQAPEVFDRFDRVTGHHRPKRVWLSCLRLVAPFLDSRDTGGMERGWEELLDEERKSYIAATLKREAILLDRPHDVRRAQGLAQGLAGTAPKHGLHPLVPPLSPKGINSHGILKAALAQITR